MIRAPIRSDKHLTSVTGAPNNTQPRTHTTKKLVQTDIRQCKPPDIPIEQAQHNNNNTSDISRGGNKTQGHTTITQHPTTQHTLNPSYNNTNHNTIDNTSELNDRAQTQTSEETHHNATAQQLLITSDKNEPSGDILQAQKSARTLRIYYQNVNGINKLNWEELKAAAAHLQEMNVNIVGCAETNINWQESIKNFAQSLIKQRTHQANLVTSSSQETGTSIYQPGGVSTCIMGNWTGRIVDTVQDLSGLGRWAGHILIGNNTCHIVVITAYRPVISTGFNTVYQQQWRLMRNQNIDKPDPRSQLLHDLTTCILKWTSLKYEIILMWDANEAITSKRSKLLKFMSATNLHPVHTAFPNASYARGHQCIDFIMGTPGILSAITKKGYTTFYDGIWHSDHRGVYCDINTDILFHGDNHNLSTSPPRHVSSHNYSQVSRYIQALEREHTLPTILLNLKRLNTITRLNITQYAEFEELDQQFTTTLLKAEKK
jgi:hypothetical protein